MVGGGVFCVGGDGALCVGGSTKTDTFDNDNAI